MLLRTLLGQGLRDLRAQRGLTLREVAERAHLAVSHLSEIERGLTECSSEVLQAICDALGVSVPELLRLVTRERTPMNISAHSYALVA